MAQPGFWDRDKAAQETLEKLKSLRRIVEPFQKCEKEAHELAELVELFDDSQQDSVAEIQGHLERLTQEISVLEFQRLLSEPLDSHNAIVNINSGAGGTESCDWAEMLLRMYLRWAD